MISVALIGNGNLATHLFKAFSKASSINIVQVNSRKLDNIPQVDVAIIAVSDDAIAKVSSEISNRFVVHTSGSVAMDSLENKTRKGVFYMLQTFSREKEVDFFEIPFCLEATNIEDRQLLEKLAKSIGDKVFFVDSDQRKALHIAAVFVNNFTNHLYKIGSDICNQFNVSFEVLRPLIKETALKIENLSPEKAQTGPAIRNDKKTIRNHLELLTKNQQEIYKVLTKSIQNENKL